MKHLTFISILLLIVIIFSLPVILNINKSKQNTAEIYCGDKLLYSIDLSKVTDPYEIPIENGEHSNTVLVENNKISMKSANCPDKLCVRQGAISHSILPIVCLPNSIIIKITDNNDTTADAVSR